MKLVEKIVKLINKHTQVIKSKLGREGNGKKERSSTKVRNA